MVRISFARWHPLRSAPVGLSRNSGQPADSLLQGDFISFSHGKCHGDGSELRSSPARVPGVSTPDPIFTGPEESRIGILKHGGGIWRVLGVTNSAFGAPLVGFFGMFELPSVGEVVKTGRRLFGESTPPGRSPVRTGSDPIMITSVLISLFIKKTPVGAGDLRIASDIRMVTCFQLIDVGVVRLVSYMFDADYWYWISAYQDKGLYA